MNLLLTALNSAQDEGSAEHAVGSADTEWEDTSG